MFEEFQKCAAKEKLEKHCLNSLIKNVHFFKQKAETLIKSRHDQSGIFWKNTTSGLKASYEVFQKIVAAKKPHDIGEQLILPCRKDFISNVLGSSELSKLKHVSLSNNTISRRITELSDNILSQVVSKIQNLMFYFFAIQFDKTTNVANLAQLRFFVCYVYNRNLEGEFLFCEILSTKTTARETFDKVDRFFEAHGVRWEHVIGVCTDGAPAMLGCRSGFQTLVKEKCSDAIGTHCTIHRQALMVKIMPDELKSVLNEVIKALNLI